MIQSDSEPFPLSLPHTPDYPSMHPPPTLNIVCSGFLIGNQLNMGSGTFGTTDFFARPPPRETRLPPPMGGGGGGTPKGMGGGGGTKGPST